jgi:hypothetical protein
LRSFYPAAFIVVPEQSPLSGTASATNASDFAVVPANRRMYGLALADRVR